MCFWQAQSMLLDGASLPVLPFLWLCLLIQTEKEEASNTISGG
jgi:hypothetical protein